MKKLNTDQPLQFCYEVCKEKITAKFNSILLQGIVGFIPAPSHKEILMDLFNSLISDKDAEILVHRLNDVSEKNKIRIHITEQY